ncbi:hypothetical protein [uncultured Mediterranean phage uvMED]|nr:hypothetical protein [uncultured Mediterranean phage uvMED]BAR22513.1 hypothetical protein [uncultured Mediterranean phage uvMED]
MNGLIQSFSGVRHNKGFASNTSTDSNLLELASGASMWGVRSMTGGNPKILKVQRSNHGGQGTTKDFYADDIDSGALLSWVTQFSSTGDGFVIILYDQSDRGYHYYKDIDFNAPKIVANGVLCRDSENKVAVNGNGAKLRLGPDNSTIYPNFFSSDGTWSVFFVTDFPNYANATNTNVQILHFETQKAAANSGRKPVIACNKNFNQLAISTPTMTEGSNTLGNIFLPTYPQEQLLSSFGNPAHGSNNNEAFLDGVSRGATGHRATNDATAVNTDPRGFTSINNVIFQPTEVGVTTFLSGLIYAPSYLFSKKQQIERELVRIFDITFV